MKRKLKIGPLQCNHTKQKIIILIEILQIFKICNHKIVNTCLLGYALVDQ